MHAPDALAHQFPTAFAFALRNQARNRLAWILPAGFVPAWFALMVGLIGHAPLDFRLFTTGAILHVDGRPLGLITAGMNSLTLIVGFAVFAAIRRALPLDRRLVFAGYRQSRLVTAKALATVVVGAATALYAALVLLVFWRPSPAAWTAVLIAFAVMAIEYGDILLGLSWAVAFALLALAVFRVRTRVRTHPVAERVHAGKRSL